jgi:hypothetical protein
VAAPSVLKQKNWWNTNWGARQSKSILERLKDVLRKARDEIKSMEGDENSFEQAAQKPATRPASIQSS